MASARRARYPAARSEVVAGVGEVEALVGEGEVRDDRAGEGDRQRGPVEEGGVDDLAAGQRAGGIDFDTVDGAAPPAFGDSQPGAAALRDLFRGGAERADLPGELGDEAKGGPHLVDPDGESRQDV